MFFGLTMVMVTVALVMGVIVTNLYGKKDSLTPCPKWIVNIALKFYPVQHIPEQPRGRKYRCNGSNAESVMSITDGEIEALTGKGCCCCCSGSNDGTSSSFKSRSNAELDRIEAEWKMISKFVDRMFFWVFVAISSCVHSVLFLQMVPE